MTSKQQDNVHNNFFKDFFSTKRYGVEFLKLVLRPSQFSLFNWDTLRSEMETFITPEGSEKRTDLIFSVNLKGGRKGQKVKIIFLVEHKAYKDKKLLFQLLEYQAVMYKKEPVPIIPVVFYHGKIKTFTQSLKFHDALEGFLPSVRKKFEKNILNFEPILLNIHDLDVEKQSKTQSLAPILFVLQKIWHLDEKTVSELFTISDRMSLKEKREQMAKAVDYIGRFDPRFTWKRIALIEQKTVKDKKERIMQLFKRTLDEALEKGIQKGIKKVALKLLQGGVDLKIIKETTELSEEEIKTIEKELKKKDNR